MADSTDGFDVLRCACTWRYDGAADIVNVVDLRPNELVGSALDVDVIDAVGIWFNAVYNATDLVDCISNLVTHQDISIYNLTDDYPVGYTGRLPVLDGNAVGEALPSGISALLTFRTQVSRRLGRKYLPPFTVAQLDDGRWTAGTMTILTNTAIEFRSSQPTGQSFELQYVVKDSSSPASSLSTSTIVRNVPAYQRRRKIGTGS